MARRIFIFALVIPSGSVELSLSQPKQAIDYRKHDDRRDEERHRRRAMKPAIDQRCGDCEVRQGRLETWIHVVLDGVHGLADFGDRQKLRRVRGDHHCIVIEIMTRLDLIGSP